MSGNKTRRNATSHELASLIKPEEFGRKGDLRCTDPSDSDTSSIDCTFFFIVVARQGDQILMRREKDILFCCHEIDVNNSSYEGASLLLKEILTFFGISAHMYINAEVLVGDDTKEDRYYLNILEVTEYESEVNTGFEWIEWRSLGEGLDETCSSPHICRFLKTYLSNMDVEEINLGPTPWRRVGFYSSTLPRIRELISDAGCEILGNPEQIHFGTLSTVFKIPTNEGQVFFKAGFKGNGEPAKTKAITSMFPYDTPTLLGVDLELEAIVSKDHGPSVHDLYIVKRDERPELKESEITLLLSSALTQWARVQRESMNRVEELVENGISVYDKSWIRSGFQELISYMKETGLDKEYEKIMCFEKNMERTFNAWDHFNIPNTLVHGDLHNSNIAQPGGLGTKFIFFDLDSTFVGHPFLDLHCDGIEEIAFGQDAYIECWKEYGDFEELKRLILWTEPVRYVIEVVREGRKEIWTNKEKREWVQFLLDKFSDALERSDYDGDWRANEKQAHF